MLAWVAFLLYHATIQSNETALLFATQRKEVRIAEELMKAKANPNYKTQVRTTA